MKYHNTISLTEFCKELGAMRKHPQQSWSSYNPSKNLALFTIWENEIINGNGYLFYVGDPQQKRKQFGAKEIFKILSEAIEGNYNTYGILIERGNTKAGNAKINSFNQDKLAVLDIKRFGEQFRATICGFIPADAVKGERSLIDTMMPSALDDLDEFPQGNTSPERRASSGMYFPRDPKIRTAVIRRARGKCEYCGGLGFFKSDRKRYIESHHIISLAKQGPDTLDNVIALCPNHHREAHFGEGSEQLEAEFKTKLAELRGNK